MTKSTKAAVASNQFCVPRSLTSNLKSLSPVVTSLGPHERKSSWKGRMSWPCVMFSPSEISDGARAPASDGTPWPLSRRSFRQARLRGSRRSCLIAYGAMAAALSIASSRYGEAKPWFFSSILGTVGLFSSQTYTMKTKFKFDTPGTLTSAPGSFST